MKKTYELTTRQFERLFAFRDLTDPNTPLPIFVYNLTNKKVKLNIKWNRKLDYCNYKSDTNDKNNWLATFMFDAANEHYLTFLLLL